MRETITNGGLKTRGGNRRQREHGYTPGGGKRSLVGPDPMLLLVAIPNLANESSLRGTKKIINIRPRSCGKG
jgi:hypothetical protein